MASKSGLLVVPAMAWLGFAMVLPLAQLVLISFQAMPGSPTGAGWTMHNYAAFLGDPFYLGILLRTFGWSAVITIICLLLGYPLAVIMSHARGWTRRGLTLVLLAPLLVSVVVRNYGWVILLSPNGPLARGLAAMGIDPPQMLFTPGTVVVALVHTSLAYAVMAVLGSLEGIDPAALRAAEGLGAGRLRIFWRIMLPLSLPGVLGGTAIVFSLAASSFVTPQILGGPRTKFVGSLVYEQVISVLNYPFGSAIGFILSIATLALLLVYSRLLQVGRLAAAFK
jgi:putative spermidine/putrescine transport system permease protein